MAEFCQDDKMRGEVRRGGSLVFWWTCGVAFLVLLLLIFIPWDALILEAPDLECTPTTIPADGNAFTYFLSAGQRLKMDIHFSSDDKHSWIDLVIFPDSPWEPQLADDILAANAPMFAELEKGLACRSYANPPDLEAGSRGRRPDTMAAQLLSLKSRQAQMAGDDAEAARISLQGLRFGQMIAAGNGSLLELSHGYQLCAIAFLRLESLASDARTPEPVLRQILAALEAEGLQDQRQEIRRAIQNEYGMAKKILAGPSHAWPHSPPSHPCANPVVEEVLLKLPYAHKPGQTLEWLTSLCRQRIQEARQPMSAAREGAASGFGSISDMDAVPLFCLKPNLRGREVCFNMEQRFDPGLRDFYHIQAWKVALQLKIALRLYELKHGELPDDLAALVPEYLKAVPQDPYDGQTFRYSKAEKKVWSVGSDLIDQGGNMSQPIFIMVDQPGYDPVIKLGTRTIEKTDDSESESQR